eukprot:gene17148-biopygen9815
MRRWVGGAGAPRHARQAAQPAQQPAARESNCGYTLPVRRRFRFREIAAGRLPSPNPPCVDEFNQFNRLGWLVLRRFRSTEAATASVSELRGDTPNSTRMDVPACLARLRSPWSLRGLGIKEVQCISARPRVLGHYKRVVNSCRSKQIAMTLTTIPMSLLPPPPQRSVCGTKRTDSYDVPTGVIVLEVDVHSDGNTINCKADALIKQSWVTDRGCLGSRGRAAKRMPVWFQSAGHVSPGPSILEDGSWYPRPGPSILEDGSWYPAAE